MPLPGFVTTDGGAPNTRFKAPVLSGTLIDSAPGGPIPPAAGFMAIQSTASITNQIVSTSSVGMAHASFLYIPVSTGSFVSSNNATQAPAPPYTGVGTPIVWNDAAQRLMIWSSGASAWLSAPAAQAFTCSS